VVGDGDRLLPQRLRLVHELWNASESVEEGELGVRVEVREHQEASSDRSKAIAA